MIQRYLAEFLDSTLFPASEAGMSCEILYFLVKVISSILSGLTLKPVSKHQLVTFYSLHRMRLTAALKSLMNVTSAK